MKIGTKSILFGAHCFFLHPWFVAEAWSRLYGFPLKPWIWVMFFVHDLGYLGSPNMDGEEGEQHPWVGAHILYWLQGAWMYFTGWAWAPWPGAKPVPWWKMARRWNHAQLLVSQRKLIWGNESLFHSRFLAKFYDIKPSRMCFADKLAIVIMPWWIYLPMVNLTGEIHEYMNLNQGKYKGMHSKKPSQRLWYREMQDYLRAWIAEHKDGREDSWTPTT